MRMLHWGPLVNPYTEVLSTCRQRFLRPCSLCPLVSPWRTPPLSGKKQLANGAARAAGKGSSGGQKGRTDPDDFGSRISLEVAASRRNGGGACGSAGGIDELEGGDPGSHFALPA